MRRRGGTITEVGQVSVERENEKKKRERREGDLGVLVAAVEDLPLRHLLSVLGVHLVDGGERRRPHQLPPLRSSWALHPW